MNKKWLIVIAYTVLILATLPFARQLWAIVGERNGFFIIIGLYTASIIRIRDIRLIGLLAVIAIAIFKLIPLPIERIHFIEYGVLGWLSYWAFGRKAFVYVIAISDCLPAAAGKFWQKVTIIQKVYSKHFRDAKDYLAMSYIFQYMLC